MQQTDAKLIKNVIGGKAMCGIARASSKAGLCSEERSIISSDYARNFICDFILGKSQPNICKTLFD